MRLPCYEEFDDAGRRKPSTYHDRIVDVMEELIKFTLLLRGKVDCVTDRYSERKQQASDVACKLINKL